MENILNLLPIKNAPTHHTEICGIKLPPIYKAFFNVYDLSYDQFSDEFINLFDFRICPHINEIRGVGFHQFHSFEYFSDGDILNAEYELERQLMPMGLMSLGGYICVGFGKENEDEIHLHFWDDDEWFKIADNIFEFCANMRYESNINMEKLQ